MAEPARIPALQHYDQDFLAWTEEQGRLLKARSAQFLDWENLAEEIESLGKSQRSEVRSRLIILLQHLLKWEHQPERRKNGWNASIVEARNQLNRELAESPSLRSYPASVLAEQFEVARLKASDETKLPLQRFPIACPYSIGQILDKAFYPGPTG